MSEIISDSKESDKEDSQELIEPKRGPISSWLLTNGHDNISLDPDKLGIEIIRIEPKNLFSAIHALKENGFNYLQCQGGYDEGPGLNLVCFYNLISLVDIENISQVKEVRIKTFLDRSGDLKVPSLYSLYRGSDWQERETYDMYGINFEGHPHPKRLLMPEDWKGWPLRKDYIQPDFYEMQDAY